MSPLSKKDTSNSEEEAQRKGLIRCAKTSSRMIRCIAEDTSMEAVLKALRLFGFTLYEIGDDIYKKDGSV